MEFGGISSAYTDYVQSQNTAESKLRQEITDKDYSKATDDELLSACKQFEA